jgi:hypothetical protein
MSFDAQRRRHRRQRSPSEVSAGEAGIPSQVVFGECRFGLRGELCCGGGGCRSRCGSGALNLIWTTTSAKPESAKQVATLTDPGTRRITAAVKRWETKTTTEAVLYLPDRIVRLHANQTGATTQGFSTVEVLANALRVVPVVALRNSDRILDEYGPSEIDDLKPLVDALNKSLADMMVTSEYVGRPRRWATGIELTEEPVLDDDGQPTGDMKEVNPAGWPIPPTSRSTSNTSTTPRPWPPRSTTSWAASTPRVPPADR